SSAELDEAVERAPFRIVECVARGDDRLELRFRRAVLGIDVGMTGLGGLAERARDRLLVGIWRDAEDVIGRFHRTPYKASMRTARPRPSLERKLGAESCHDRVQCRPKPAGVLPGRRARRAGARGGRPSPYGSRARDEAKDYHDAAARLAWIEDCATPTRGAGSSAG